VVEERGKENGDSILGTGGGGHTGGSPLRWAAPVSGKRARGAVDEPEKVWRIAHGSSCLDYSTSASGNRRGRRRLHRDYGRVNEAEAATARRDEAAAAVSARPAVSVWPYVQHSDNRVVAA
jgi:hypothetical protein